MDWIYLSKLIPLFLYPLNFTLGLLFFSFLFNFFGKKNISRCLTLMGFLIFIVSAVPWTSQYLIKNLEREFKPFQAHNAPVVEAVIILGGALALPQYPRTDLELVEASDRIRFAVNLYKAKKAKKIIISGGNVFPQRGLRGEAYYIVQLIKEWGVPKKDILFEEKSRNTYENALYVKPILRSNGISNVLLVTSATHMKRAYAVFRAQKIEVIPAITDIIITDSDDPPEFNWIPSARALWATTWIMKEYLGWWYYKFKGYI